MQRVESVHEHGLRAQNDNVLESAFLKKKMPLDYNSITCPLQPDRWQIYTNAFSIPRGCKPSLLSNDNEVLDQVFRSMRRCEGNTASPATRGPVRWEPMMNGQSDVTKKTRARKVSYSGTKDKRDVSDFLVPGDRFCADSYFLLFTARNR